MWKTEDNLQVSLFFQHVGCGDITQDVRLEAMFLYPPSHLSGPGKSLHNFGYSGGIWWYLLVASVFISTGIHGIEHLFTCLSANHVASLCKQYAHYNKVIYPIIKSWQCIIYPDSKSFIVYGTQMFSFILFVLSPVSFRKNEILNFGCSPICYYVSVVIL